MTRFLVAMALLVLTAELGRAADISPSYNLPNTGVRVPPQVMLCPSTDGSASAIPCSFGGGGSSSSTLGYTASTTASVTTSSTMIVTAGAYTHALNICTLSSSAVQVWLNLTGNAAVAGSGVPVPPGGGCVLFGPLLPIPTSAITAISGTAQSVSVAGG